MLFGSSSLDECYFVSGSKKKGGTTQHPNTTMPMLTILRRKDCLNSFINNRGILSWCLETMSNPYWNFICYCVLNGEMVCFILMRNQLHTLSTHPLPIKKWSMCANFHRGSMDTSKMWLWKQIVIYGMVLWDLNFESQIDITPSMRTKEGPFLFKEIQSYTHIHIFGTQQGTSILF